MRILLWEYITGGGLRGESLPAALAREGEIMLRALLEDLLAVAGVSVILLRDDRLPDPPTAPNLRLLRVDRAGALDDLWRDGIAASDAVWPVAPETGGVLERLCREVVARGKLLLNTPAAGVSLAASKHRSLARLAAYGLPVVPTAPAQTLRAWNGTCVLKPDDGVGCEGARIIDGAWDVLDDQAFQGWIVQPLIEGEALSLSLLFAQGRARLLACNRQRVARAGDGFVLLGCQVNALADGEGRWQSLATEIARACPELWGYAGVDLLLTATGPLILEVNPRLTTSYAGLRPALGINPAALVLDLARNGRLPPGLAAGGRSVDISLEHACAD